MILTETTTDTMCTSGIITDATSGGEKYPSGHINKVVRYVRNIYRIPFSHMKIYIDVSIQISHIVYMSEKKS